MTALALDTLWRHDRVGSVRASDHTDACDNRFAETQQLPGPTPATSCRERPSGRQTLCGQRCQRQWYSLDLTSRVVPGFCRLERIAGALAEKIGLPVLAERDGERWAMTILELTSAKFKPESGTYIPSTSVNGRRAGAPPTLLLFQRRAGGSP